MKDTNTPRPRLLGEAMEAIKDLDYPDMGNPRIAALVEHVRQGLKDVRPQAHHWMISDRLPMDPSVARFIPSWDANWPQIQSISGDEKPIEKSLEYLEFRRTGRTMCSNAILLTKLRDDSRSANAGIPPKIEKPNWRKNRMAFLNGLNKKKY